MKNSLRLLLLIISCCLLVGCVSTKYVERKQYLFDSPKNLVKKNIARSPGCSIFIERVIGVAPFDRLDFLYRTESNRYLIDYYNGFLTLPSEQLDTIIRTYLQTSGDCDVVVAKPLGTSNILQIKLVELYADYRTRENPQAVIALQFYLTKLIDDKNVILFDKTFRMSRPLQAKDSESLLSAWNEGLQNIISQALRIINQKL